MTRGGRITAMSVLDGADQVTDLTRPQDFPAQGDNPGRLGRTLGGFGQCLPYAQEIIDEVRLQSPWSAHKNKKQASGKEPCDFS